MTLSQFVFKGLPTFFNLAVLHAAPTPHPGLYNQLEPLCIMLACTLQASKAPTPKPCDALSCPQHAVPVHAQHGGSTPCRASDPEIGFRV